MKKLTLAMLLLFPMVTMAQRIEKNEIDKFTKQHVVETSQEELIKRNKWKNRWERVLVALRNVNGEWVLPAFIELGEIEKYDENSTMSWLLDNGEVVILKSFYTGIGSEDCPIGIGGINHNVHGFTTVFNLSDADIEMLRKHTISDVRVSPLGKNYDFVVGKDDSDLIMRMIKVVDNTIK